MVSKRMVLPAESKIDGKTGFFSGQQLVTIRKYSGIPSVIFSGNVTPSAMGTYNPGSAFGAAMRMAAGTAMYDALAASIAKMNLLPASDVMNWLK